MPTTGPDVHLERIPGTGLFDLAKDTNGDPERTDSMEHSVLAQLVEHRGSPGAPGWVLDETGTHGSLLYLVTEDRAATPSTIEAYDALQVLVDEGEIRPEPELKVSARRIAPGRFDVQVRWVTTSGREAEARVALRY
jgi:phage gp46-like protein